MSRFTFYSSMMAVAVAVIGHDFLGWSWPATFAIGLVLSVTHGCSFVFGMAEEKYQRTVRHD